MKVLSFDLGLRHLAWIVMTFEDKCLTNIDHWHCDSAVSDTINVNSTSLELLVPFFVKCLDTIWSLVDISELDMVLIESQPMGHGRSFGGTSMGGSPRNLKTKVFSHILQGFLLQKRPELPIHFVSPTLKMKGCTIPFRERSQKDNKKQAIQATEAFFQNEATSDVLKDIYETTFVKASTKKDDLSDCFLQAKVFVDCLHNGSLILSESKPVEKTSTKKAKVSTKKETKPKEMETQEEPTKKKKTRMNAAAKRRKVAELCDMDDS